MRYSQSDNDITKGVTEDTPNKLQDPICNVEPDDLILDEAKLHKSGVSFICSKQDQEHFVFTETEVIIKKGNTCALLYNFHHVMTIEQHFQHDGTSKWWLYRSNEASEGEEAFGKEKSMDTNVYCW